MNSPSSKEDGLVPAYILESSVWTEKVDIYRDFCRIVSEPEVDHFATTPVNDAICPRASPSQIQPIRSNSSGNMTPEGGNCFTQFS